MKKVIVIWGWADISNYSGFESYLREMEYDPYEIKEKRWKDNLQTDLGDQYDVISLPMPNKGMAEYRFWKIMFEKVIPYLWEENIFVGHSLGGSFLCKYFGEEDVSFSVSQIHLVAPATTDTPEEYLWSFRSDLTETDIVTYEDRIFAYFSKDDFIVPFNEYSLFKKALPNAYYEVYEDMGHFHETKHLKELVKNIKSL